MKIKNKGRKNADRLWMGKFVECNNCGCSGNLDEEDRVKLVSDQRDGDYYEIKCPSCGSTVTLNASLYK